MNVLQTTSESARVQAVPPRSFDAENHFYSKVLNAQIHPLAAFFLNLSPERIIARYCHLHPMADPRILEELISYKPHVLHWGGVDLLHCTTAGGKREMVVIETNSSPSGHKSMPIPTDFDEQGSYRVLIERTFGPIISRLKPSKGVCAVLYDKNLMEVTGYAASLADHLGEEVFLVPSFESTFSQYAKFENNYLFIRQDPSSEEWMPVRAALRYVTQRPWNRIPVNCRTLLFNPILACLAGGRNKLLAAKAYDLFNAEIASAGLEIRIPETMRDVPKAEVPFLVKSFGGHAVVKVPYANAGQGVFTITSPDDLAQFMEQEFQYDNFIVQSLIGNYQWSSDGARGRFYQVGTIPSKKNRIFVADLRMMIGATPEGYRPVAFYARKAKEPLVDSLEGTAATSADMLVTNLSVKLGAEAWATDPGRLLIFDRKDFNTLGMGLDALIDGYIQSILAINAIDRFAVSLLNSKGRFRFKLFRSLNNDEPLLNEILIDGNPA
ncbi:MAG: hypothetical protein KDD55_03315 [Bdellovibrionales bacterium]|nr:hypothetical protein [Bdellovibrionales bacterium]